MRTVLTSLLLAASAVVTVVSVGLGYDADRSGAPGALVYLTAALWMLFALAVIALRGVRGRAAVVLVLVGSVAIGGAALSGPPNTSTDSARYAWDGIVQNAGISPYAYTPLAPQLEHLRTDWLFPDATGDGCRGERIMRFEDADGGVVCSAINRAGVPTIYPPLAELLFAGVRFVVGPDAAYWPLQLVGLLASLGITVILLRVLMRRGSDPRWAALWGWCPLVATEAVTNSHVDVFGALLLLVATVAAASRRPWVSGIALGAAISAKLIPVIGAPALLRRRPWPVVVGAVAVFALLYVPYVLASGIGVVGYLPGYLSEEGYESGDRFVLASLIAPGAGATIIVAVVLVVTAFLVWWTVDPGEPWVAQTVMIGVTLIAVSPRYAWYALLLVPFIALSGRWEWMLVGLAATARMLVPFIAVYRIALLLAIIAIVVLAVKRAGPGWLSRARSRARHPLVWLREARSIAR